MHAAHTTKVTLPPTAPASLQANALGGMRTMTSPYVVSQFVIITCACSALPFSHRYLDAPPLPEYAHKLYNADRKPKPCGPPMVCKKNEKW